MNSTEIHFDGPVVAGGHAYDLDVLASAPEPVRLATGFSRLDDLTGGLDPGSVWTIAGCPGTGVTAVAASIAAGAAKGGDVLMCNSHVGTRRMAGLLTGLAGADSGRLRLSSWLPLMPEPGEEWADSSLAAANVLVIDTWDENWPTGAWPATYAALLSRARWLRELARSHGTSLVLTARRPPIADPEPCAWIDAVFHDIADVSIELTSTTRGTRAFVTRRADSARWFELALTGRARLTPTDEPVL